MKELEKDFPTYELDEHFLTKLKDKKPDAKALDIEAVRAAIEEAKRPIGQQLALKIKARNVALTEAQAAGVAAAILKEADKYCFPGWWNVSSIDPELSKALLLMIAQQFSTLGLLAGDAMEFIGQLVQVLKSKHYKPVSKDA